MGRVRRERVLAQGRGARAVHPPRASRGRLAPAVPGLPLAVAVLALVLVLELTGVFDQLAP
jgi:hypothetical protein